MMTPEEYREALLVKIEEAKATDAKSYAAFRDASLKALDYPMLRIDALMDAGILFGLVKALEVLDGKAHPEHYPESTRRTLEKGQADASD